MRFFVWFIAAGLFTAGCDGGGQQASGDSDLPLVVFSQANSQDPWRQVFDSEISAAAGRHADEFRFTMQGAQDKPDLQISQVEAFLLQNPKVLIISPATEALESVCSKAYREGIHVILLDRGVPGDEYTTLIGGDNVEIGRKAAEYIADKLDGKGAVLMIKGKAGATATNEREGGAMEVWRQQYPNIKVIEGDHCDYQRNAARNYMATFLQRGDEFDVVYAHNDEMAIGAWMALNERGITDKLIVGVDACQKEAIQMIIDGKLTATLVYPVPAQRGIEIASDLINGAIFIHKKIILKTMVVDATNAEQYLQDNPSLVEIVK